MMRKHLLSTALGALAFAALGGSGGEPVDNVRSEFRNPANRYFTDAEATEAGATSALDRGNPATAVGGGWQLGETDKPVVGRAVIGAPLAAQTANIALGQVIEPPANWTGEAPSWDTLSQGMVAWIDYAKTMIAIQAGPVTIDWPTTDGGSERQSGVVSAAPSKRPVRLYWTHERPADTDPGTIYAPLQNAGPTVSFGSNYRVQLHGTSSIQVYDAEKHVVGDVRLNGNQLEAFGGPNGHEGTFLITYSRLDENTAKEVLVAYEVVEVLRPMQTQIDVKLGERLRPLTRSFETEELFPDVTRGLTDESGAGEIYVYQHKMDGEQKNYLWAIRDSSAEPWKIEVYWRAKEELDIVWPFEVDIYAASWDRENAQVYLRDCAEDGKAEVAPKVFHPSAITATAMDYQIPKKHMVMESGAFYSTYADTNTFALIRFTNGDSVWFQTVRSLPAKEEAALKGLGLDVGSVVANRDYWTGGKDETFDDSWGYTTAWLAEELRAPFAGAEGWFYPGFVRREKEDPKVGVKNPYNTTLYAYPNEYTITNDLYSPIFPVNMGTLEVWWALPSKLNGEQPKETGHIGPLSAPIYYPSVPVTYTVKPPTEQFYWDNGAPQIVIASGLGASGWALNDNDPWVASPSVMFDITPNGGFDCLLERRLSSMLGGETQYGVMTNFTVEARFVTFAYSYASRDIPIPWVSFSGEGDRRDEQLKIAFDCNANLYVNGEKQTSFDEIPVPIFTNASDDKPSVEFHLALSQGVRGPKGHEYGEFTYYVNGQVVKRFVLPKTLTVDFSGDTMRIFEIEPRLYNGSSVMGTQAFTGYMSNFRVWAGERSWEMIRKNRYLEVGPNGALIVEYGMQEAPRTGERVEQWELVGSLKDTGLYGNHAVPAYDRNALGRIIWAGEFAQAPLRPHGGFLVGSGVSIYRQNDRAEDGYNPNEEHALIVDGNIFALRCDLNVTETTNVTDQTGTSERKFTSLPYVLVQFRDQDTQKWRMKAIRVVPENDMYRFDDFKTAGNMFQAPDPIARLQPANLCRFESGPVWLDKETRQALNACAAVSNQAEAIATVRAGGEIEGLDAAAAAAIRAATCFRDRKGWYWAQQAGDDGGTTNYVFEYSYPSQPSFDFPDGRDEVEVGAAVSWMQNYVQRDEGWMGRPTSFPPRNPLDKNGIDYTWIVQWADEGSLYVNETLYTAKNGMPEMRNQLSCKVVYEQSEMCRNRPSVRVVDPTRTQTGSLTNIPDSVNWYEVASTGMRHFSDLPPYLIDRFYWNGYAVHDLAHGRTEELRLDGVFKNDAGYDPYLWLNVLDERARQTVFKPKLFPGADDPMWVKGIESVPTNLVELTRDDQPRDTYALMTTGRGAGYVTLVFNDSTNLDMVATSENVEMHVIRVEPELYNGTLHAILSDNPVDKQQNMKYTADFGGHPEAWEFVWEYADPTKTGQAPGMESDEWKTLGDNGSGLPMLDWVTVGDEGVFGLSDHYIRCRYRALDPDVQEVCGTGWTKWTKGALAEGWIKRVLKAINPFEQRYMSYLNKAQDHALNTQLSMIQQAGAPYDGDVPLNSQAMDESGLLQIYETVLHQARKLSIDDGKLSTGALSLALQMAAGRIAELYTMLGNEALADAMNPTVDLGADSDVDDGAESSIFPFMNECMDLLDEELCLLRGRDCAEDYYYAWRNDVEPWYSPVYNRLIWNLSSDIMGGQVAYILNYGISDLKGDNDGQLDVSDAQALYPQGHGDAWGHYLSAVKGYYTLLRHPNFAWPTQIESILAYGGSAQITVSFLHEKRFAQAAAAKARAAQMIVAGTCRQNYEAGAQDPWLAAEDDLTPTEMNERDILADQDRVIRHWGNDEWATRGHLGAYYDWLTVNALLPARNAVEQGMLQMLDRESTLELGEIATAASRIQREIDAADAGLNPLGLSESAVPFDISPSEIDDGKTHFEQIYERAERSLQVAHEIFLRVKGCGNALRDQNEERDFDKMVADEEAALDRELISIYGTPYTEDIGVGKIYPKGYNGPDLQHYYYVETYDVDKSDEENAKKGRYIDYVLDNYSLIVTNCTGTYQAEIDKSVADYGILGNLVVGAINLYNKGLAALSEKVDPWLKYGGVSVAEEAKLPVAIIDTGSDELDGAVDYDFTVAAWTNDPYNASYFVGIDGYTPKPSSYTSQRKTEGSIQIALAGYGAKLAAVETEMNACRKITTETRSLIEELNVQDYSTQIEFVKTEATNEVANFYAAVKKNAETIEKVLEKSKDLEKIITESVVEALPKVIGVATDPSSVGRSLAKIAEKGLMEAINGQINDQEKTIEAVKTETEKMQARLAEEYKNYMGNAERQKKIAAIEAKASELKAAVAKLESAMNVANEQRMGYAQILEKGRQLQAERARLRVQYASELSGSRYRNMYYQIFRNDELRRYNEAFESAAKYAYLAAKAYDYETGLLQSDSSNAAGREFMSAIVRSRALGRFSADGKTPLGGGSEGDPGLSDVLYRMNENWQVLKGRLGFNNPQNELDGFSLRKELFRKNRDDDGDAAWKSLLQSCWTDDIKAHPAFARLAQPLDPMETKEPGFVIPFRTVIAARYGFFGNNLEEGDNAFSSTYFATKIRGVGIWLEGAKGKVANRPEVYLIPAGLDYMRVPVRSSSSAAAEIRAWDVVDQVMPIPYPLSESQWETADWNMLRNVYDNELCKQRRHPTIRASIAPTFEESLMSYNARLIGRSVWNDQWYLIVPAASLHSDNATARKNFVEAVDDIHLYLKTYSFSGN